MFDFLKKSRVPEAIDIEPDILWAYPLDRFASKEEPFTNLKPPDTDIRADMHDLCEVASIGYIFQFYYILLYKTFGTDVSNIVAAEHVARLNVLKDGFGDELRQLLSMIQNGMESCERHPYQLPESGVELPLEFYVAMHLLFVGNGSPYFGRVELLTAENGCPSQELHNAIFDVAECLVWNRDRSIEHFAGALRAAKIDAAALKRWVDMKGGPR